MSSFQRVIKYCAMAFAAILAISIIGGILSGIIAGVGCVVNWDTNNNSSSSSAGKSESESAGTDIENSYENIEKIRLDIGVYKVVIEEDSDINEVSVETNDVDNEVTIDASGDTLEIESHEENWFGRWFGSQKEKDGTVYIYVPDGYKLSELDIDSGVGSMSLSDIETDSLVIDSGVGSVTCNNIQANEADIDSGVGSVNFDKVNMNDVTLSAGVGSVDVDGVLTGDITIEGGVGSIELDIDGNRDDYNIKSETGMGGFYLDGEKAGNVNYYSSDIDNSLYVEGGMGSIHVSFH